MRMPVLFVGHGSPMNAIEDNSFTQEWRALGRKLKPKAVLMVSAHWFTRGLFTQDAAEPEVVNDMYGFPEELYRLNYRVRGSAELTDRVLASVNRPLEIRNDWGLDHGAWSVLVHMYPDRDVPVVQLSVDAGAAPDELFAVGRDLRDLRNRGILIIGSGNVVHNLRLASFDDPAPYEWNTRFDAAIRDWILGADFESVVRYADLGEDARLAVPSTDHFDPLLYVLGAAEPSDGVRVFNEASEFGSLSMTSYLFE